MDENPSQCPVCEGPMKDWQSASPFEWQPIETAPRDGTQFLALLSNGWYELLRDRSEKDWPYQWWTATGNVSVPIVETHPADTDWSKTFTILATHWMPLPGSPKAPATAEAPIPPEPVAVLRYDRSPGNENDMPKVVSCNWLPDGEYEVFLKQ